MQQEAEERQGGVARADVTGELDPAPAAGQVPSGRTVQAGEGRRRSLVHGLQEAAGPVRLHCAVPKEMWQPV